MDQTPEESPQPLEAEEVVAEQQADEAALHAVGEAVPLVDVVGMDAEAEPETEVEPEPEPDGTAKVEPETAGLLLEVATTVDAGEADTAETMRAVVLGGGGLVLERKHPLAIRWMHWINFPVLFTMIWSGWLIYWNDSDNAYQHPHAVYRVGVGSWTLFRFFPAWVYTNQFWDVRYRVTTGLGYHFFFMWLFAINGILYVLYLLWSREWKFMVPDRKSIVEAIQVTLVDLHLRKGLPAQTKYNGAQKIAYTSIILMGLGSLVTGLAIYKPTQAHWLTSMLGGYEMARWLHFLLTIGFCGFFLVHVGQVVLAGWNNFRSMVSGYELRRSDEPSLEAERRKF